MKVRARGFSLVELLVVIGVVAVLVGLLVPAVSMARKSGQRAKCLSNLKQLAAAYQLYLNDSRQRVMRVMPIPTEATLVPYAAPTIVEVLNPFLSKAPPRKTPTGVPAGSDVFACPADYLTASDLTGKALTIPPGVSVTSFFDAEGTSYEYNFYFNASAIDPFTNSNKSWPQALADAKSPAEFVPLPADKLPLLVDYSGFHGPPARLGSRNAMFADFHAGPLDLDIPALVN